MKTTGRRHQPADVYPERHIAGNPWPCHHENHMSAAGRIDEEGKGSWAWLMAEALRNLGVRHKCLPYQMHFQSVRQFVRIVLVSCLKDERPCVVILETGVH